MLITTLSPFLIVGLALSGTTTEESQLSDRLKRGVDSPVMVAGTLQPGFAEKQTCRTAPEGQPNAGEETCHDIIYHVASNTIVAVNGKWTPNCKANGAAITSPIPSNTTVNCTIRPKPKKTEIQPKAE